jgi:hypothetical protein
LAVGLGGTALPTKFTFTTEDLTPTAAGNFGPSPLDYTGIPDPTGTDATDSFINPNEVIQIGFFENIAGDSATVTVKDGCTGAKPIAFSDRGSDKTVCTKAEPNGFVLDVVNSDTGMVASGKAVDWPAGSCTVTVTVPAANGKGPSYSADYSFVVGVPCKTTADCAVGGSDAGSTCMAGVCTDPSDGTVDANISSQHLTPVQCTM